MRIRSTLFVLILLCFGIAVQAQQVLNIAIVNENEDSDNEFDHLQLVLKKEINDLLVSRYDITFEESFTGFDEKKITETLNRYYADPGIDIVIALGSFTSGILTQRSDFPKPSIAGIIIDPDLQAVPITPALTSGIDNLSYLLSPFDVERDLKALYRLRPFENVAVIGSNNIISHFPFLDKIMKDIVSPMGASYNIIPYQGTVENTLAVIPPNIDAVMVLPVFNDMQPAQLKQFYSGLNERSLPSIALFAENGLANGALMGHASKANFQRIPRRIALNVMKIVEGQNPANLPVEISTYNETLMINMMAARSSGNYPDFDLMSEATILNIEVENTDRLLTLPSAIEEALKSNLVLKIGQKEVAIVQKDIDLAMAELLPQVSLASSFSAVDEITALSYQGAQGQLNWLGSASASQVLLAEPLLANRAIQQILKKSEEFNLKQTQLDLVVDVTTAYLNVLQAQQNLRIQQENVSNTKENYDISKAKESIGYVGATDLNRWESQLALGNIDLNQAFAQLRQAKFQLNQLLNRPINEAFNLDDVSLESQMLMISDGRLELIDNYGTLDKFSDFLVAEGLHQLPELAQIDMGIEAQNRLALSQKRAFYLPQLSLSGQANQVITKSRVPDAFTPIDNVSTWELSLGAQYPIFQGGSRRHSLEQTQLGLLQLNDSRDNTANQLEQRIRSNMETVAVSFSRMELSQTAADASLKNFEIVQNAYSEGQQNITTLIDAQNNALQTKLSAVNAVYTFVLDFLVLERSIGFYWFLAEQQEKEGFFARWQEALNN